MSPGERKGIIVLAVLAVLAIAFAVVLPRCASGRDAFPEKREMPANVGRDGDVEVLDTVDVESGGKEGSKERKGTGRREKGRKGSSRGKSKTSQPVYGVLDDTIPDF